MVTYSIWSWKLQTREGVFSLTRPRQQFFHSTDAPLPSYPNYSSPTAGAMSHPSRQKLVSPRPQAARCMNLFLGEHHSGLRNFTPTLCGFLPAMHK